MATYCEKVCKYVSCNTIAFAFLFGAVISVILLIVASSSGPGVYEYFTTCHGDSTRSHLPLLILLASQTIITLLPGPSCTLNAPSSSTIQNVPSPLRPSHSMSPKNQEIANTSHSEYFSSNLATESDKQTQESFRNPITQVFGKTRDVENSNVDGDSQYEAKPRQVSSRNPVLLHRMCGDGVNSIYDLEDGAVVAPLEVEEPCNSNTPEERIRFKCGICWNSLWMAFYYTIFFMGFHASLLGWRVYGTNITDPKTLRSCQHMNTKNFEDEIPLIRSVLSDFTYIEVFLTVASAMLHTRKYGDPYLLTSYFRLRNMARFYILQVLIQIAMTVCVITNIVLCWTYGYGTPMQIISALLLANGTLWVLSVLTHVLQVDNILVQSTPTLEYHWLWAIICLFVIWLCGELEDVIPSSITYWFFALTPGFLFYLSVYMGYWSSYFIPHICLWLFFSILSITKFKQIFRLIGNGEDCPQEEELMHEADLRSPSLPPSFAF